MTPLLLSFYLVPAAVVLVAFWAVWRLVRLLDLSVSARRTLFVVIGTMGLAPMLVPAGTIMAAWVPHGLLLLTPDIGYYVRFSRVVVPSFALTAAALGLVAWWRIRGDVRPVRVNWATFVGPIAVFGVIAGLYRYSIPDRDLPAPVTIQAVESAYGDELDAVAALSEIDDSEQRRSAVAELQSAFESDPAVLRVSYPGTTGVIRGEIFYYLKGESPSGASCSGAQPGLMRCTWSYDTSERLDVLRYSRSIAQGEEAADIAIDFYYDEALDVFAR